MNTLEQRAHDFANDMVHKCLKEGNGLLYSCSYNFILKESIICHFIIIGIAPSIPPFPLFPLV